MKNILLTKGIKNLTIMITKKIAAGKLLAYLERQMPLPALVEWAENALFEANFHENEIDVLTTVLGRLGLADVRAFGLSWEDCEDMIRALGYGFKIQMTEVA